MSKTSKQIMGDWGESNAITLLENSGYTNIVDLNKVIKHNFPIFDILAEKDGKHFLFTVKARHKYQPSDGLINPQYNIISEKKSLHKLSKALEILHSHFNVTEFEMYWITCPITLTESIQTFYIGRLDSIEKWRRLINGENSYVGIKMKDKYLTNYIILGTALWP